MPLNLETATRQEIEARMAQIRSDVRANTARVEQLDRELDTPGADRDAITARQETLIANSDRLLGELDELERAHPHARSTDPLDQPRPRVSPPNAADPPSADELPAGRRGALFAAGATPVVDAAIPGRGRYADIFGQATRTAGVFKSLGEFVRAVGARDSQRLQAAAAGMSEGVGADGGYLVPGGFTADLLNAAYEQEIIRPRSRVLPLLGKSLDAPVFSYEDRTKGPAALIGYWASEAASLTAQKAKTRELGFSAKKLTILLPITNELLYDAAPQSDAYLREAMSGTISTYLDRAFYFGSGAGQPLGILNGTRVTVSKEGSQTASTINFENVSKMISRLVPGSFQRSVWLAHPSTLPQLMQLQIKVKNVAGSENVGGTVAPIQVAGDGSMSLMTRPVIVTDLASALGTEGDLALCDFSGYAIAMQPQMRFAVSEGPGFTTDETYFRVTVRCDAMPILGTTVTPRTGSDALAHFVTLETRS